MGRVPVGAALREIERIFGEGTVAGLTEAQLLDRFVESNDGAAFEVIVRRHGPAVMAVCRRLLGDPHEAEDAFQATFLVLARRAGDLGRARPIGPWLVGVAYRVASKARVASARRRRREAVAAGRRPEAIAPDGPPSFDLAPILWEELHRLPSKYRDPIVLCWVEGRSHDEAAERLRWPIGTVKGRLHRARETLRLRLSRRGITAPAAGLSAWFSTEAAAATVPAPVLGSTVKTAAAVAAGGSLVAGTVPAGACLLARGALRTMAFTKLSTSIGALAVVGGTVASGWGAYAALDGSVAPLATSAPPNRTTRGGPDDPLLRPVDAIAIAAGAINDRDGASASSGRSILARDRTSGMENVPGLVASGESIPARDPGVEQGRATVGIDALKARRVQAAEQRVETLRRSFLAGLVDIDRFLDATRSLLDARLDAALNPRRRRAVLEDHRSLVEAIANHERNKPGMAGSDADKVEAEFALAEAELMLVEDRRAHGGDPSARTPSGDRDAAPDSEGSRGPDEKGAGVTADPDLKTGALMGGGVGSENPDGPAGSPLRAGRGDDPASKAIKAKLDVPISIPFERDTPLAKAIDYIRQATADKERISGIPIYVDEVGLQEVDQSPQSPIRIDLEGVPLRTTLWLALKQLDLAYTIIDGVLIISNPDALRRMIAEEPMIVEP